MAKYELMANDILNEYEIPLINYYEDLLKYLQKKKKMGCKFHFGSKWIRVYGFDNENFEILKPPSLTDFINYCKTKGIRFIKK